MSPQQKHKGIETRRECGSACNCSIYVLEQGCQVLESWKNPLQVWQIGQLGLFLAVDKPKFNSVLTNLEKGPLIHVLISTILQPTSPPKQPCRTLYYGSTAKIAFKRRHLATLR